VPERELLLKLQLFGFQYFRNLFIQKKRHYWFE